MKSDEQVEWHCSNFMGKEVEVPNMAIAALPGKSAILATLSEPAQNMSCPGERKWLQIY